MRIMYAVVLACVGVVLLAGGGWLIWLGGSAYYLLAAGLVLITAELVRRRHAAAVFFYAALLLLSLAWALWESGVDRWGLSARLLAPALLGIPFLFAPFRQSGRAQLAAGFMPALLAVGIAVYVFASVDSVARTSPGAAVLPMADSAGDDWKVWGGDEGGTRYSPLSDITPANVNKLKVAWTYRFGTRAGGLETTPLKIGSRLYACNVESKVDALDTETGRRLWRFDPREDMTKVSVRNCRGVAYYESASRSCPQRIITATLTAKLWALDANTGKPCADFGTNGVVDLARGMGPIEGGYYAVTSAPTIVRGKIIVGGWVTDGQKTQSPPGVVRAYDVNTGAFAWAFDIGRLDDHREPPPGATYTLGSPNVWAPMSADEKLGLVYAPTGNAGPDYYGAQRTPEFDRYSSSIVALDVATGAVRWSFQTVHHDIWDYDVPAQPTLIDLPGPPETIPALIQATKQGQVFVLDRRTGKPIHSVVEKAVGQKGAPGERVSPTQPFSVAMPSLAGPDLTEQRMWGLTPLDQLWCRIKFKQSHYNGVFTPPQLNNHTIEAPGFMGAVSWGGVSVDVNRGLFVVNSNRIPTRHQLITRSEADARGFTASAPPNFKTTPGQAPQAGTPFASRHGGFLSPLGVPCNQPPFGVYTAVDIRTGKVVWERPLGTGRDGGPFGWRSHLPLQLGVPNFGGSLVTGSGLAFIGATQEEAFRAVDITTGAILWSARLPAGGNAVPMTYRSAASGRQFVVIAAGGKTMIQNRQGDYLIAYALP